MLGRTLCAAGGAAVVGFYDLGFNDRQSLIVKTSEILRVYFFKSWDASAWGGLVVILLIAMFLCAVRKPKALWSATEVGFGVVASITTMASPMKQESISRKLTVISFVDEAYAQQDRPLSESGSIMFKLDDQSAGVVSVQVREAETAKLLQTSQSNKDRMIRVENISAEKDYLVYVEENGKKWTIFRVNSIDQNKLIEVKMRDSRIPMPLQRFLGPDAPTAIRVVPAAKALVPNS